MSNYTIGSLCKRFSAGSGIPAKKIHKEGLYPVYGANGIRGYTDTYNFDGKCAIIGRQGAECGNVHYFEGKAFMTEHAIVAEPNEDNVAGYLAYKLGLMNLGRYQGQSAQPGLSANTLSLLEISVPSFAVQQKVFNYLKLFDSKITNNNAISKELESMAKTIYDYWFLQFEFPDKDGKPYKSNGGKMVWNEQLKREIPEGWEASIVKNILGDYPRTKTIESKEYNLGSLYPIIDQSKDSYICGYTDNKDYVLNVDDAIVFGDHSNKSKYVNFPFARGADGTQILNSNNPRLPNYLLYQEIIALPEIEKGYSRHFKFLKAQNITIPTLDITKKYMSIVSNMLLQQREIIKENQQLQSLRDFLLPMLMNGQVIIED